MDRVTKSPSSNAAGDEDSASARPSAARDVRKVRLMPWASRDLAAKLRFTTVANGEVAAADDVDDGDADVPGEFHSLRLAASSSNANSSTSHARSQDRTYASSAEDKA